MLERRKAIATLMANRPKDLFVVPGLGENTNIRLAWHGVRAGVLGAALLARQEVSAMEGSDASRSNSGARHPVTAHEEASGS